MAISRVNRCKGHPTTKNLHFYFLYWSLGKAVIKHEPILITALACVAICQVLPPLTQMVVQGFCFVSAHLSLPFTTFLYNTVHWRYQVSGNGGFL